ncbi:MAG: aminotransferase class I/II-fold pyridoxal phosphate-dependent enzyme [Bacteroidales bacterium]|nr:aminotransferase class I/II-fold pyridoxal phosphate-dependent enzyme [Bacteroidales bacterium]
MNSFSGEIRSKLQKQETSIFAVMSALAKEHNAINLSQGFPDFPISSKLIELVGKYMRKGYNQYAPMTGVSELRHEIAAKVETLYGSSYDPDKEINITAGATQALHTAIAATIRDEDEVIVFEPAYDAYVPLIKLHGGIVKYAALKLPDYSIDWQQVKKLISNRTRMIIINSPHNPTGAVLGSADMEELQKITRNSDIIILSDEVYEHLIFDNLKHESVCRYPELASRAFVVGSFGKTFHATGWKTGFILAPENLMQEFRKVHQFVVFAANTPIQHAIAEFLTDKTNYLDIGKFYQRKRDLFLNLIAGSKWKPVPSHGTYFQLLDYSAISDENEISFAERLTKEHKLASIPVSVFYHKQTDNNVLRFCFAKEEETLQKAADVLNRIT